MPQRAALRKHPMKSAMLVTCGSNTDWNMDAIMVHYKVLQQYLPWEDQGVVLARNVFARKDIEGTALPAEARILGTSLWALPLSPRKEACRSWLGKRLR